MTITNLIPGLKGVGRHRGKSPVQLRRELDEATCHLVAMATEINELRAERTQLEQQLDEAGIELSGARNDLDIADREQRRLQDAVRAWEARWANAHPVSVPAPRDLRPSDERPTVPTDVSSVRAIFPVVPIAERPATPEADASITKHPAPLDATKPTHVPVMPVMPDVEDTQPIPAA